MSHMYTAVSGFLCGLVWFLIHEYQDFPIQLRKDENLYWFTHACVSG